MLAAAPSPLLIIHQLIPTRLQDELCHLTTGFFPLILNFVFLFVCYLEVCVVCVQPHVEEEVFFFLFSFFLGRMEVG